MEEKREKIFRKTFKGNNRLKTIVLDSNILIDNVHGFAKWLDKLFKKPQDYILVIPTIVVAEYLNAKEIETAFGEERSKKYLSVFKTQDLTFEIAEELARILRRKTYSPGTDLADLIVASTAIHLNAELVTRNKSHFKGIPSLRFFDPSILK